MVSIFKNRAKKQKIAGENRFLTELITFSQIQDRNLGIEIMKTLPMMVI